MQTGQKVRRVREVKHWLQHRVQPCSGFPCLKYHAATLLSIYRAVTGFPRVLNATPRKGVGCRSMQTHRLSCSPLTSIRVACVQNRIVRGVQQKRAKLNASITRQPCASFSGQLACQRKASACPSAHHFLLDFDHHKVSKIEI